MTQTKLGKVERALILGTAAHVGQVRKYIPVPYMFHPVEVANICAEYGGLADDEDALCAALLHDVVEDTSIPIEDIEEEFGRRVAEFVTELTEVEVPGNRATRKEAERLRLNKVSDTAQTIKLADMISNTKSIAKHDPGFAKVYLEEKAKLLPLLDRGNRALQEYAYKQLMESKVNDAD
jgi:(p)ppGpp synthase/HD superfamily hydrolase